MNDIGLTREHALQLVEQYVIEPVTRLHLLETEAIMKALAKRFGENEEVWGIIGLLHDIDWDIVKNHVEDHCITSQDILRKAGGTEFLIETIVSHAYNNDSIPSLKERERTTVIQYCLVSAETLTGLIMASALMQPDKKLASVKLKSLKKKFKTKSFAARCDRNLIMECEKANIPLDEFLAIGLTALQGINEELGY